MDWTEWRCHACCPPKARGVYYLAHILQGHKEQTSDFYEFVLDVLKYSYRYS